VKLEESPAHGVTHEKRGIVFCVIHRDDRAIRGFMTAKVFSALNLALLAARDFIDVVYMT
jgi:hypothetical protein